MTIKFNAGVDVGYNKVKAVSKSKRVGFLSITGTPEQAGFSFNGDSGIILTHPYHVAVGDQALEQSEAIDARIDRGWLGSDKWHALALAALSELTTATSGDVFVVAGLPVSYYSDKAMVQEALLGRQSFQRKGRTRQTLTVTDVEVMPQGFGALFAECLNDNGKVADQGLRRGRVGIVDCGGKTTNLLCAKGLKEVGRESGSVDAGGWNVVKAVHRWLQGEYPDLTVSEYDLVEHVVSKSITYHGEPVDLTPIVDHATDALTTQIVGAAKRLWNGSARLEAVLVAGGGAHLVGEALLDRFPQGRIVADPVYANAVGYWRFAQAVNKG